MTVFDLSHIRDQFPALALEQDARPVIYLDGPGGTQVPQRVIDAVSGYYRTMNANDGGAFLTSRESAAMVADTRAAVADLLGAGSPDEVHLGANMTTLTFHLSRSIGATLGAGDEVVVTTLDHEANVSPWRALAGDRDLVVRTVDIRPEDGTLDLDSWRERWDHARGWSRWVWRRMLWGPSTPWPVSPSWPTHGARWCSSTLCTACRIGQWT